MSILSRHKVSPIFLKYLFSYLILIIFVMIVMRFVVYNNFVNVMENEAENFNVALLQQVKDIVDSKISDMKNISVEISSNTKLTPYMVTQGGYNLYQTINELKKYKTTHQFIYQVGLYYHYNGSDRIYTATSSYYLQDFFEDKFKYKYWGMDDFKKISTTSYLPKMIPSQSVKVEGTKHKNFLTYLYPLLPGQMNPIGTVMFIIEQEYFEGLIKNALRGYSGYVYILDEKSQLLLALGTDEKSEDPYVFFNMLKSRNLFKNRDTNHISINSNDFLVEKIVSEINDWSYIIVVPTSQFLKEVHISKRILNYSIFFISF